MNHIIVTGTSVKDSVKAAKMASQQRSGGGEVVLYSTAGVHPHDAKRWESEESGDVIAGLVEEHPGVVVAIGETGLDYNRMFSSKEEQIAAFEAQIELAVQTGLPLFLHERDAFEDFYAILAQAMPRVSGAVVHCFTGSKEALDAYVALGCYIGITGWVCDERRGLGLREIVGDIPMDRILIETDAPFLKPRGVPEIPKAGKNEPAYLPYVALSLAEAMGVDVAELIECSTANARTLFSIQ